MSLPTVLLLVLLMDHNDDMAKQHAPIRKSMTFLCCRTLTHIPEIDVIEFFCMTLNSTSGVINDYALSTIIIYLIVIVFAFRWMEKMTV